MKTFQHVAAAALSCMTLLASPAYALCKVIPLDMSGPRPTVAMTIANGRTGIAVFDTGAMSSATVDTRLAEQLGLVKEGPAPAPFDQMPGITGYSSTLHDLRLGGVPVGDIAVSVLPTPVPFIAALLGPKMFAGMLIEMDLGAGQLRLCERNAALRKLGVPTPYAEGPVRLPGIPVIIGNISAIAHADSGSPMALSFPMRFAQQVKLVAPLVRAGTAHGHTGASPVFAGRIKGVVRVGALTLIDPEAKFSDVFPIPNVGTALLRQLVLSIDPVEQRTWTYLTRPKAD